MSGILYAQEEDFTDQETDGVRFAVVGDFGSANEDEQAVADLIDSWDIDFIISTGDNYYRSARGYGGNGFNQFDNSVGKYYCQYLKDTGVPDTGNLDCPPNQQSQTSNRFFPTIGNHDRHDTQSSGVTDYLGYFSLPGEGFENSSGNERYYDFVQGPIHFFALDSDTARRDYEDLDAQRAWLKRELQASTSVWNVVFFHQSAYSSANHGSDPVMQWPFSEWGADIVFQGHDHVYERILRDDIPYIITGNGGRHLYEFETVISGSIVRYDTGFGAVLVTVDEESLNMQAWGVRDEHQQKDDPTPIIVDAYHLPAVQEGCSTTNVPIRGSLDDAVQDQATGRINLSSTDLVMVEDRNDKQFVGLRFDNVVIPPDTTIHKAGVEFTAREYDTTQTDLIFYGEAADNAQFYTPTYDDISTRPRTSAQVEWKDVPEWYRHSPRARYLSADLTPIVQEIVDREGWTSGNAIAFVIDGSGTRTAYAYDHGGEEPPLLSILYCDTADIGDEVWVDLNDDGLHDSGDYSWAGVTVKLWSAGPDGAVGGEDDQLLETTLSGNQGYGFQDLDPGDYFLEFVPPRDFQFTRMRTGEDAAHDKDIDPATGRSKIIHFDGTPVRNIDAGLTPNPEAFESARAPFLDRDIQVMLPWALVIILSLILVALLTYIIRLRSKPTP